MNGFTLQEKIEAAIALAVFLFLFITMLPFFFGADIPLSQSLMFVFAGIVIVFIVAASMLGRPQEAPKRRIIIEE